MLNALTSSSSHLYITITIHNWLFASTLHSQCQVTNTIKWHLKTGICHPWQKLCNLTWQVSIHPCHWGISPNLCLFDFSSSFSMFSHKRRQSICVTQQELSAQKVLGKCRFSMVFICQGDTPQTSPTQYSRAQASSTSRCRLLCAGLIQSYSAFLARSSTLLIKGRVIS